MYKEYILTAIVTVLTRGMPILVMPLLTNGLSIDNYGLFAIYIVVINLFTPIIVGNLPAGILREGIQYNHRGFKLLHIVSVYCLLLAFLSVISWFIFDFNSIYLFLFLLIASAAHQECIVTYFRANYRDYSFLFLSVFRASSLVIPAILVTLQILDLKGLIGYYCLGYLATSVIFTPRDIWGNKLSQRHLVIVKSTLAYCMFLIPYAVGQWIISSSSRAILGYIISEKEAGLFSIAYTLASPVVFLFSVIGVIFSRSIIADSSQWIENYRYRQKVVLWVICGSFLCTASSLSIIHIDYLSVQWINYYSKELTLLTGLISISLLFHCMYSIYGNMLFYLKKTKILAKNSIVVGVSHLVHSYYFISYFGIVGTVYSIWISYLFTYLLTFYNVKKTTSEDFQNGHIDMMLLAGGMFLQILLLLYFNMKWQSVYIE